MSQSITTKLIKIGNSKGIRIPKALIEQAGLGDAVFVEAQHGRLVVSAARPPRYGWDEQFQAMATAADDKMLDDATPTEWETAEWDW